MTDDWVPAFEGQRPPFTAGNTAALRHGAYSAVKVLPLAREIERKLLATPGLEHLHSGRFTTYLKAYAAARARADLVTEWAHSMTTERSLAAPERGQSPFEIAREFEESAATLAQRLGLDPQSAAKYADEIAAARKTVLAKHERRSFQDDLKASMREQQDRDGYRW